MSETVKVIVTLSKGQYENLKDMQFGSIGSKMIFNAVKNGTPLPKRHGRLIDADDIDNHIIGHVDTRSCPTIIEADEVSKLEMQEDK